MSDIIQPGETAIVTEDWSYTSPVYSDTNSGRKGEKFVVSIYIDAKHSDSGFAFYRGTRTIGDRMIEVLCPADKCERVGIPTAKQCTHEDMNCPPGECEDLYPPNREDMGR